MMKKITIVAGISAMLFATACKTKDLKMNVEQKQLVNNKKEVVYQVFTRLLVQKNSFYN